MWSADKTCQEVATAIGMILRLWLPRKNRSSRNVHLEGFRRETEYAQAKFLFRVAAQQLSHSTCCQSHGAGKRAEVTIAINDSDLAGDHRSCILRRT